jgi:hypothetical protein
MDKLREVQTLTTLKEATDEIRATIKQLDEAASKSEVFIQADKRSVGVEQLNVGPRKIAFDEERAILLRLIDLYNHRAKLEDI